MSQISVSSLMLCCGDVEIGIVVVIVAWGCLLLFWLVFLMWGCCTGCGWGQGWVGGGDGCIVEWIVV